MTASDIQQAAARKAARDLVRPLKIQLERAERTITALTQKLAAAEAVNIELRRKRSADMCI